MFIKFLFIILYLATAISLFSEQFWLSEIFVSATLQLAIFALMLGILSIYKGQWTRAVLASTLVFWHGGQVTWFDSASSLIPPIQYQNPVISIKQHNILRYYDNNDLIIEALKKDKTHDIIFLQEVEDELDKRLIELKEVFPHQVRADMAKKFDKALLSRLPIISYDIVKYPYSTYIRAVVEKKGHQLTIYGVHTASPGFPERFKWRNEQLAELAERVAADKSKNIIVVGDMNVTPYSFWFKDFINKTGLKNSMQKYGLMQTFPSFFFVKFLQVPIDHLLYSPNLRVAEKKVMPALMSDHYAISTSLEIGG